jgi:hypothetical protein
MTASSGTKSFVCTVEDREGAMCTFFGSYSWFYGSDGIEISDFNYFPHDSDLGESIFDWILNDIKYGE